MPLRIPPHSSLYALLRVLGKRKDRKAWPHGRHDAITNQGAEERASERDNGWFTQAQWSQLVPDFGQ